jgi:protein-S-isoprenylcysteine O-methyltransferase Ste14
VSTQRALDLAFALTALVACVVGIRDEHVPLVPRLAGCAVSATVCVLFLRRSAAMRDPQPMDIVAALPSVLMAGLVQRFAAPEWTIAHEVLFAIFGALTVASLATLGGSFAIFPARRALVVRGPYALVRHPVYLGELAMLVTASSTRGALAAGACLLAMLVLLIPRIRREEKALAEDAEHAVYASRVRYRLFPGLY